MPLRTGTLAVFAIALAVPAAAQQTAPVPSDLRDVGITQNLDAQLPLDLRLTDENGETVELGRYFKEGRPVLLTLGYYRCPMLCDLVLNGLIAGLQEIDWVPGREFDIVTVSIDPLETPQLARLKKQGYMADYARAGAARGWHFMTASEEVIEEIADTVGFQYEYVESRQEFAHAAAIFVITPDGRVSRYLFGVVFDPRTLRLSLVEAAEGGIGSVIDQFLLYCYAYDAEAGQYTPVAWRIMRLGGVATVLLLGMSLVTFWIRETRRKRAV